MGRNGKELRQFYFSLVYCRAIALLPVLPGCEGGNDLKYEFGWHLFDRPGLTTV